MKVINLEQGSEKWFEYKWGRLGGSTVKHIKSDKRNDTFFNILSQLRRDFEIEESFTNDAMLRGTMLEDDGCDYLSSYTGIDFQKQGVWEYNKYFSVSPDRANKDLTIACEHKAPSPKTHAKYIYNGIIPEEHLDQCVSYFVANENLKELYFISYCPEDLYQQGFIIHIDLNTEFEVKKKRFKTLKNGELGKSTESYLENIKLSDIVKELKESVDNFSEELDSEISSIRQKF